MLLGAVLKVQRVEFPCDDAVHGKWTRAIITKLQLVKWKEATGASLKHFESRCFATEGVCTFDATNEYMEASKASMGDKHGAGQEFYPPYSISLIKGERQKPTVPSLGPYEDQTIPKNVRRAHRLPILN